MEKHKNVIPNTETKIERFNEYIKFLDGKIPNVKMFGKTYKKVDIKFNIGNPTEKQTVEIILIWLKKQKRICRFSKEVSEKLRKRRT